MCDVYIVQGVPVATCEVSEADLHSNMVDFKSILQKRTNTLVSIKGVVVMVRMNVIVYMKYVLI